MDESLSKLKAFVDNLDLAVPEKLSDPSVLKLYSAGELLTPSQKFANLEPNTFLEENLIMSLDGHEVLFKIATQSDQILRPQYMSLDLVNKQMKLWSNGYEHVILSKSNPFTQGVSNESPFRS